MGAGTLDGSEVVPAVVRRHSVSEHVSADAAGGRGVVRQIDGIFGATCASFCDRAGLLSGAGGGVCAGAATERIAMGGVGGGADLFLRIDVGMADSGDRERFGKPVVSAALAGAGAVWRESAS